ncbi:MAG: glycine cleavage system protein H [Waddliaceae bacterium]|nr:glycine cleavage system protein H [Waddliaceae bacterium]
MKFTESHEWVTQDDSGHAKIGISMYAQKELGEIVYVELPELGREVSAGDEIAVLESTKAASDVYSPVSGIITSVNEALLDRPELVNSSPEADGWLFMLKLSDPTELSTLMTAEQYQASLV